ncbi:unnamed protein product [Leptidea sinapis]|uniref:E3 ubiquitin-protein ligase RNF10 n=1 Tax=Leptidea sinapis TaxID=189913 RepID=A0A5E4Q6T2_9NEOP|nr:unnamed protein product [Leptidea sinapis]
MLEDPRMDKKSLNRSNAQQSRASAIDCKKNLELTHKPLPRNNKKRETSASNPKNENNRKNLSTPRARGQLDKRPRPRGSAGIALGGAQSTGIENDDEAEVGSLMLPGSKKQNLNHLLNFMYSPRGNNERPNSQRSYDPRMAPVRRHVQNRSYHKFEHDLYLRAYCQFVVRKDVDVKEMLMDPDLPIKWDKIEEIVVRSAGNCQCPICLGQPVAGRVGKCGHVYCWACVLHYTSTHDKQPPPCPVCAVPLQVADMKPTRLIQWDAPAEQVTMRLVRRLRGSSVVEVAPPRGALTAMKEDTILPLEEQQASPFAKLFSATHQQILDIAERDKQEIEAQIQAEIDTTELVYLEQALQMLKIKKEMIPQEYVEPEAIASPTKDIVVEENTSCGMKYDWFDVNDEEGGACAVELSELDISSNDPEQVDEDENKIFDINENTLDDLPVRDSTPSEEDKNDLNEIDKENQAKYFYFYQADDGQQVFLNSLNVRMLNASWGALVAAPEVIHGRVLHRDTISLGEQTRKHMPHTAHLPLHCSIDVVELDLRPPYVTQAALDQFAAEIQRRARNRAKLERDERRRERAYHRAMEGPPKPDFSSEILFPTPSPFGSPPSRESFSIPEQVPSAVALETSTPVSPSTSSGSSGLSFAKMAGASGTWRVRKSVQPSPPPPAEHEDEGHAPRSLVLSDAIEAALLATSPVSATPNKKKNKKTKQKILFATGMTHTS